MTGYVIATLDIEAKPPTVKDVNIVVADKGWSHPPDVTIVAQLDGEITFVLRGLAGVLAAPELAWTYQYPGVVRHLQDWLSTPELPSTAERS